MLNEVKSVFGAEEKYLEQLKDVKVIYPENEKDVRALIQSARQTRLPDPISDDIFAKSILYSKDFSNTNIRKKGKKDTTLRKEKFAGETKRLVHHYSGTLTTAQHIRNASMPKNDRKHQHGLRKNQLQALPQKIAAPVMILDSLNTESNSIVIVTDMLDEDSFPVIAIVRADGRGMYNGVEVDTNFVTSYYGKNGFERFVQKNVEADTILFVDRKKAAKLSTESSTQWLEQLKDYSFDTIIRKTHAKINLPQKKYH